MHRNDIINAETPLLITVPAQLTKSKRRKNSYHCVFAEACQLIPQVEEAIVHLSTAYLRFKGEDTFRRYRVQTKLRDQIVAFDKYGDFEPGEYRLGVLQASHQANGRRQGSNKTGYGHGVRRSKQMMIKGVRTRANLSTL
jgi:hypothetical protein